MGNIKLIFLFLISITLTVSASAQSRMSGKVVEVVNGRTVVIDTDGRKVTAEIQYVEVPEPEQPLFQTVREHLEKLTLGKTVEFRPHGFKPGTAVGQLFVGSTDLAVQMLRDGAAWHVSPDKSGQNAGEGDAYQYHQNQAKLEQRGVWGVKGLKPAWQFRADKVEQARQAQIAAEYAQNGGDARFEPAAATKAPARRFGFWSDINPSLKNPGPLTHGYNAASKTGYVGTSLMGVKELENVPPDQKVACDVTYIYKQESEKSRKGTFVFTLVSAANDQRFLKANNLTVMVDEKNVVVGKPKRTTAREDGKAIEKLTYEVSKTTIEKIVYGGEVVIKIGDYALYPGSGLQLLLYNMLQVAG